jgi:hypothetical protein
MSITNKKEMKNFFHFYYSDKKTDYVSATGVHHRCDMPCELDHPNYWSNIPFNWITTQNNSGDSVACLGCSFTFGDFLKEHETWPYILGRKISKNVLNFGVSAGGIDSILLNLIASSLDYKFNKVIILLPDWNRRIARMYKNNKWFRWPVTPNTPITWGLEIPNGDIGIELGCEDSDFIKIGKQIQEKIIKDKSNSYSKKTLERIVSFCRKKHKNFYLSSWSDDVYSYLRKKYPQNCLAKYDQTGPKASDGQHPSVVQNTRFVDNIVKDIGII